MIIKMNDEIITLQKKILQLLNKKEISSITNEINTVLDVKTLLSLPASLRKTLLALYKLRKATAEDLSKETKRLRAVESNCANQLVRMGYVKKRREGKKVYFYLNIAGGLE